MRAVATVVSAVALLGAAVGAVAPTSSVPSFDDYSTLTAVHRDIPEHVAAGKELLAKTHELLRSTRLPSTPADVVWAQATAIERREGMEGPRGVGQMLARGGPSSTSGPDDGIDNLPPVCQNHLVALATNGCVPQNDNEEPSPEQMCRGSCRQIYSDFVDDCAVLWEDEVSGATRFFLDLICLEADGELCYTQFEQLDTLFDDSNPNSAPTTTQLEQFCSPCTSLLIQHMAAFLSEVEQDGDATGSALIGFFNLVCLRDGERWCMQVVNPEQEPLDCADDPESPTGSPDPQCLEAGLSLLCRDRCYRKVFQAVAPFINPLEAETIRAVLSYACIENTTQDFCWPLFIREANALMTACPTLQQEVPDCSGCGADATTFVTNTGCCLGTIDLMNRVLEDDQGAGLRAGVALCNETIPARCPPSNDPRPLVVRLLHVQILRSWVQANRQEAIDRVKSDVIVATALADDLVEVDVQPGSDADKVVFTVSFQGRSTTDTDAASADIDSQISNKQLALVSLSAAYGADTGKAAVVDADDTRSANDLGSAGHMAVSALAVGAAAVAAML